MGKPKQIYSDEEGGLRSLQFNRFMNENDMKSIQTSTHAHTVEIFIKTFLDIIYRRLNALNKDKSDWVKHADSIVKNIIPQNIIPPKSLRTTLKNMRIIFG